jgi:hypothetical protein
MPSELVREVFSAVDTPSRRCQSASVEFTKGKCGSVTSNSSSFLSLQLVLGPCRLELWAEWHYSPRVNGMLYVLPLKD